MIFLLEVKIKGSFNGRLEPPVWGRDTSVWGPEVWEDSFWTCYFVEFLSVKRVGWEVGGLGIPVGFEFMSCFFLIQVGFVELMFFRLLSKGCWGCLLWDWGVEGFVSHLPDWEWKEVGFKRDPIKQDWRKCRAMINELDSVLRRHGL